MIHLKIKNFLLTSIILHIFMKIIGQTLMET